MKRVIVDFSKLNPVILDLLVSEFPDGYGIKDIIQFKNAQGITISAVKVKTEDTVYLVKIGKKLDEAMEDYSDLNSVDGDGNSNLEDFNFDDFV